MFRQIFITKHYNLNDRREVYTVWLQHIFLEVSVLPALLQFN